MMKKSIFAIAYLMIAFLSLSFFSACNGSGADDSQSRHQQQVSKYNSEELTNKFLDIALRKDAAAIKKLVDDGFDPNKLLHNRESFALLFIVDNSYKYYDKKLVEALLSNGAKIDLTNITPTSSLYNAVRDRNTPIVKDLLDLGADPNLAPGRETPLHLLVRNYTENPGRREEILDTLLAHPKIDLKAKDMDGHEPLYFAYYSQDGNRLNFDVQEVIDKFAAKGVTFVP